MSKSPKRKESKFDFKDVRIEITMMALSFVLAVVALYHLYQVEVNSSLGTITASTPTKIIDMQKSYLETEPLLVNLYLFVVMLGLALLFSLVLEHQKTTKYSKQLILGTLYTGILVTGILCVVETYKLNKSQDSQSPAVENFWRDSRVKNGDVFEIMLYISVSMGLLSVCYLSYVKLMM